MIDENHYWSKVTRGSDDECWPFNGSWRGHGYRAYQVNGRWRSAHAVALELKLGRPIRAGFEACHTCDNRQCCNPSHLWEGSRADNARDMAAKGRGVRAGQRSKTWRENVGAATKRRPPVMCPGCGRTIRGGLGNLRQHQRSPKCQEAL